MRLQLIFTTKKGAFNKHLEVVGSLPTFHFSFYPIPFPLLLFASQFFRNTDGHLESKSFFFFFATNRQLIYRPPSSPKATDKEHIEDPTFWQSRATNRNNKVAKMPMIEVLANDRLGRKGWSSSRSRCAAAFTLAQVFVLPKVLTRNPPVSLSSLWPGSAGG